MLRRLAHAGRLTEGEFRPGAQRRASGATPRCCAGSAGGRSPGPARRSSPSSRRRWRGSCRCGRTSAAGCRGVDGVLTRRRAAGRLPGAGVRPRAVRPVQPAASTTSQRCSTSSPRRARCVWAGAGPLPGTDGWVSLHPADTAPLTLPDLGDLELTERHREPFSTCSPPAAASSSGSSRTRSGRPTTRHSRPSLWDLTWSGYLTNDTIAPLRALLSGGSGAHPPARPHAASPVRRPAEPDPRGPRPPVAAEPGGPPDHRRPLVSDAGARLRRHAQGARHRRGAARAPRRRHPGAAISEQVPGGFAAVYKVLARFEESGRCRRGYFVAGLGAAQFSTPGAVDRLRALATDRRAPSRASDAARGPWCSPPPIPRTRSGPR